MKLNTKQILIIVGSLVIGFVINWLLWLVIMKHPGEIGAMYQVLVTVTIGAAFVHIGDSLLKADIFR